MIKIVYTYFFTITLAFSNIWALAPQRMERPSHSLQDLATYVRHASVQPDKSNLFTALIQAHANSSNPYLSVKALTQSIGDEPVNFRNYTSGQTMGISAYREIVSNAIDATLLAAHIKRRSIGRFGMGAMQMFSLLEEGDLLEYITTHSGQTWQLLIFKQNNQLGYDTRQLVDEAAPRNHKGTTVTLHKKLSASLVRDIEQDIKKHFALEKDVPLTLNGRLIAHELTLLIPRDALNPKPSSVSIVLDDNKYQVHDDGQGMSLETLLTVFLQPRASSKRALLPQRAKEKEALNVFYKPAEAEPSCQLSLLVNNIAVEKLPISFANTNVCFLPSEFALELPENTYQPETRDKLVLSDQEFETLYEHIDHIIASALEPKLQARLLNAIAYILRTFARRQNIPLSTITGALSQTHLAQWLSQQEKTGQHVYPNAHNLFEALKPETQSNALFLDELLFSFEPTAVGMTLTDDGNNGWQVFTTPAINDTAAFILNTERRHIYLSHNVYEKTPITVLKGLIDHDPNEEEKLLPFDLIFNTALKRQELDFLAKASVDPLMNNAIANERRISTISSGSQQWQTQVMRSLPFQISHHNGKAWVHDTQGQRVLGPTFETGGDSSWPKIFLTPNPKNQDLQLLVVIDQNSIYTFNAGILVHPTPQNPLWPLFITPHSHIPGIRENLSEGFNDRCPVSFAISPGDEKWELAISTRSFRDPQKKKNTSIRYFDPRKHDLSFPLYILRPDGSLVEEYNCSKNFKEITTKQSKTSYKIPDELLALSNRYKKIPQFFYDPKGRIWVGLNAPDDKQWIFSYILDPTTSTILKSGETRTFPPADNIFATHPAQTTHHAPLWQAPHALTDSDVNSIDNELKKLWPDFSFQADRRQHFLDTLLVNLRNMPMPPPKDIPQQHLFLLLAGFVPSGLWIHLTPETIQALIEHIFIESNTQQDINLLETVFALFQNVIAVPSQEDLIKKVFVLTLLYRENPSLFSSQAFRLLRETQREFQGQSGMQVIINGSEASDWPESLAIFKGIFLDTAPSSPLVLKPSTPSPWKACDLSYLIVAGWNKDLLQQLRQYEGLKFLREAIDGLQNKAIAIEPIQDFLRQTTQGQVSKDGDAIVLRELAQNVVDAAHGAIQKMKKAHHDISEETLTHLKTLRVTLDETSVDGQDALVVGMRDHVGIGSVHDLVHFLLTPDSSSKLAQLNEGQLLGMFGKGFFTVFQNADAVRITTCVDHHKYEIVLSVEHTSSGPNIIVKHFEESRDEDFGNGTLIEKIMLFSNKEEQSRKKLEIETALHTYLEGFDPDTALISYNSNILNDHFTPLTSVPLDIDGKPYTLRIRKSFRSADAHNDSIITVGGSYLANTSDVVGQNLLALLPPSIHNFFIQNGPFIIDLPKGIPDLLVSTRTSLKDQYLKPFQEAILVGFVQTALQLYVTHGVVTQGLPRLHFYANLKSPSYPESLKEKAEQISSKPLEQQQSQLFRLPFVTPWSGTPLSLDDIKNNWVQHKDNLNALAFADGDKPSIKMQMMTIPHRGPSTAQNDSEKFLLHTILTESLKKIGISSRLVMSEDSRAEAVFLSRPFPSSTEWSIHVRAPQFLSENAPLRQALKGALSLQADDTISHQTSALLDMEITRLVKTITIQYQQQHPDVDITEAQILSLVPEAIMTALTKHIHKKQALAWLKDQLLPKIFKKLGINTKQLSITYKNKSELTYDQNNHNHYLLNIALLDNQTLESDTEAILTKAFLTPDRYQNELFAVIQAIAQIKKSSWHAGMDKAIFDPLKKFDRSIFDDALKEVQPQPQDLFFSESQTEIAPLLFSPPAPTILTAVNYKHLLEQALRSRNTEAFIYWSMQALSLEIIRKDPTATTWIAKEIQNHRQALFALRDSGRLSA